jgi:hypothetical protein
LCPKPDTKVGPYDTHGSIPFVVRSARRNWAGSINYPSAPSDHTIGIVRNVAVIELDQEFPASFFNETAYILMTVFAEEESELLQRQWSKTELERCLRRQRS